MVHPLDADEERALVEVLHSVDPGRVRPDADQLRDSGGVPLLIRHLMIGRGAGVSGKALAPDPTIQATLSAATARVLATAAAVGPSFDSDIVTTIHSLGRGVHEVAADFVDPVRVAMTEAIGLGLVRCCGHPDYAFTHRAVHGWAASQSSLTRRASLHARAAVALGPTAPAAIIAGHYARAGPSHRDEAIGCADRAGAEAMKAVAFDEAARWYQLAIDLEGDNSVDRTRGPVDRSGVERRRALGEALSWSGHRVAAAQVLAQIAPLVDSVDTADLYARVALTAGLGHLFGQGSGRLLQLLQRAEELAASAENSPEIIALHAAVSSRLACEQYYFESLDEVRARARRAVALAERHGPPPLILEARIGVAYCERGQDRAGELFAKLTELIADAEELGDPNAAFMCRWMRAGAAYELGDFETFDSDREACEGLLGLVGGRRNEIRVRCLHAIADTGRGRFAEADAAIDPTGLSLRLTGTDEIEGDADVDLFIAGAYLEYHRGGFGDLVDLLAAAAEEYPDQPDWRAAHAVALTCAGRRTEAAAVIDEHFTPEAIAALPRNDNWAAAVTLLATAVSECPPTRAAGDLADLLGSSSGSFAFADPIGGGLLSGYTGKCLIAAGRFDEALVALDLAVERNRDVGLVTYLTITLIDRAVATARLGRRWPSGRYERSSNVEAAGVVSAAADLREAAALARSIGMRSEVARADDARGALEDVLGKVSA